ncbi:MAG: hypothetical protein JSS66_05185 [Armatimonadetes bacterium]|nr:hypothetical protein [Armatimonadota bacterium]
MKIHNILGKLGIGRATGRDGGTGTHVPVATPDKGFDSGARTFVRKAQTEQLEEAAPQSKPAQQKKRLLHPVLLVSRFKYPYVKKKTDENGDRQETGELGWKFSVNQEFAEEQAAQLYAYGLYLYHDKSTGKDTVTGKPIDTHAVRNQTPDEEAQGNRELEQSQLELQGTVTRFTTSPRDPNGEAQRLGADIVPAAQLGIRSYEVMPSPVAANLYREPSGEDPSKIPTWTKPIIVPTEESPTAYGTSFRYRFSEGSPVPTLNSNKHVLAQLLSVNGEKAPKDPGPNADFNIYEYMTQHGLWDQMDANGHLAPAAKAQVDEAAVEADPELEHFTLGGGSLVNLGGKEDGVMSDANLLARALHYLGNPELYTYINSEGTSAFQPKNPDNPNTRPLHQLESQLHAARQAYGQLAESLSPAERRENPELEALKQKANHLGLKLVELMASQYPSSLRQFILKHPYVGHAVTGDHGQPGGKHESPYALSSDTSLTDKGKTLATYESAGGLQNLPEADRKLYALRKAFERNADNALNNSAKTLHNQRHVKTVDVNVGGTDYKVPMPRREEGWTDEAKNALGFVESHWLKDHVFSSEEKDAISQLQAALADQGVTASWGQAAVAYLRNQQRLRVKKYTQGASYLTSPEHVSVEGPYTFEVKGDNEDDTEFVKLHKYVPNSESAEKLRNEVLRQNLFSAHDVNLAEQIAGRQPFEDEDDVLFSLWADGLLRQKRQQMQERAEKAANLANERAKKAEEHAKGKPGRWPHALTSQRFSEEERAEFAFNLENYANELKNQAGAVLDTERRVTYTMPDGTQVPLPSALPVELPAGAPMPIAVERLMHASDDQLLKHGVLRTAGKLYWLEGASPVVFDEEGNATIGKKMVNQQTFESLRPEDLLADYKVFLGPDGTYRHLTENDRIQGSVTTVKALGGERVALPADKLDEQGLQLLVQYANAQNPGGHELKGGQVQVYPSDNDKINTVYQGLLESGFPQKAAWNVARQKVMDDKMAAAAVKRLSSAGADASEQWKIGNVWIPNLLRTVLDSGHPYTAEAMESLYGDMAQLKEAAMHGRLDEEDARQLVSEYMLLTGGAPQQEGYVKPLVKAALMSNYDKGPNTPGLPNNKFWHMLMSGANKRFMKPDLDSEAGNDLAAQALSHLMQKPERDLEGEDLEHILGDEAVKLMEKTLKPAEKRIQRVNPRFKKGARSAVEQWRAMPLHRLLASHRSWLNDETIFPPELVQQAQHLAQTQAVVEKREKLFPDVVHATEREMEGLNLVTAMTMLLQRQAIQTERTPQKDVWDLVMESPGVDPNSPQWLEKAKLAALEAARPTTPEALAEMSKLRSSLRASNPFEVDKDTPCMPIDNAQADAVVDEPMMHALNAELLREQTDSQVGIFGKANRALAHEANSQLDKRARGEVYPKRSVAQESTEPLVVTDDEGRERDLVGDTPEEYSAEYLDTPLYNDEEFLTSDAQSAIAENTKNILGGGQSNTLLGQFRQNLNRDLFMDDRGGVTRAARAQQMYDFVFRMAQESKQSIARSRQRLTDISERNPREAKKLQAEIQRDENILHMIDAYKVFDHLAKMVYYGNAFTELATNDIPEDTNPMDYDRKVIELAAQYDMSAREVWNFITRTIFLDKENIARGEAGSYGVQLSKEMARHESQLSQEDRDETSRPTVGKILANNRLFESPVNAAPSLAGAGLQADDPKEVEKILEGNLQGVSSDELYRFLARSGITYAVEMSKLDKLAGRHRVPVYDPHGEPNSKVKYQQEFTQGKDLAWFVNDWLSTIEAPDDATSPFAASGFSTIDEALSRLERKYTGPGIILWGNPDNNVVLATASPLAMAYSLLAKYVAKAANATPEMRANWNALLSQAIAGVKSDAEQIRQSMNYGQLDEMEQGKIDYAISAVEHAESNPGLIEQLRKEYSGKDGEYKGTDPRDFTAAKQSLTLQLANGRLMSELIQLDPAHQTFIDQEQHWQFEPKRIAAYIASTVTSEIVASLVHTERPGDWSLNPMSAMQRRLGKAGGEKLSTSDLWDYVLDRLDDYSHLLQSQIQPQTLGDLSPEGANNTQVDQVLRIAEGLLKKVIGEGLGASGEISTPLGSLVRQLHVAAQPVYTAIEERATEMVNARREAAEDGQLAQFDQEYVRPMLSRIPEESIDTAVARTINDMATGESLFPVVQTALKSHVRAQQEGESDEDYAKYRTEALKKANKNEETALGYGTRNVEFLSPTVFADPELKQGIYDELRGQTKERIKNLKDAHNTGAPMSYNKAVHQGQIAQVQALHGAGQYPDVDLQGRRLSNGAYSHGMIGTLNLDTAHPLYQQVMPYFANKKRRPTVEAPDAGMTDAGSPVDTAVPAPEPVHAIALNKLVRIAELLDSAGRYGEADSIDRLALALGVTS